MKKTPFLSLGLLLIIAILAGSCQMPLRGGSGLPTATAIDLSRTQQALPAATDSGLPAAQPTLAEPAAPPVATATQILGTQETQPTPTVAPTVVPPTQAPTATPIAADSTPVLPANAVRIQFAPGGTAARVSGELNAGQSTAYVVQAQNGQTMTVNLWSPNGDVYLSVTSATGQALLESSANATTWTGKLPATGDYFIQAKAGGGRTSYAVDVIIPALGGTPQAGATAAPVDLDPRSAYGTPKLSDPMNGGNKAAWVNAKGEYPNTDYIRLTVSDGIFNVTGKQAGFSTWWFSWPELEDSYIELTVNTNTCSGKDAYGLIIRGPEHLAGESYGYVAAFSCDGSFQIYRVDSADPFTIETLVDWTQSPYIAAGSNQRNVLGIRADGQNLAVYANGHRLAQVTDTTYGEGRYGLYVSPATDGPYTYRAEKLEYWLLGSQP